MSCKNLKFKRWKFKIFVVVYKSRKRFKMNVNDENIVCLS